MLLCLPLKAAVYYVATTGNDSTGDGSVGNPWLTFSKANSTVAAGDTVVIRGGIYNAGAVSGYGISPAVSGTPASPITYSNYLNEVPIVLSNSSVPSVIGPNFNYLRVFGVVISNCYRSVSLKSVAGIEIGRCKITGGQPDKGYSGGILIYDASVSNYIHDCVITNLLAPTNGETTYAIRISLQTTTNQAFAGYNVVENNTLSWCGHDCISCYGFSNVVRGNWIHNEPWRPDYEFGQLFGNRCIEVGGLQGYSNLIESNRCTHAGVISDGGCYGIELAGHEWNIIRKNVCISNTSAGIGLTYKAYGPISSNFVYANSLYGNGFGQGKVTNYGTMLVTDNTSKQGAITLSGASNNFIFNNVFYANTKTNSVQNTGGAKTNQWGLNSFSDSINPQFTSTNGSGPFDATSPNLAIGTSSALIDSGGWLTTVTSANGTGTSFVVAHPGFFRGPMDLPWVTVAGDTIQLQGQTATATIASIDYGTGTISFNPALTWTTGQGVSLPYNSSNPDLGAYEASGALVRRIYVNHLKANKVK